MRNPLPPPEQSIGSQIDLNQIADILDCDGNQTLQEQSFAADVGATPHLDIGPQQ